MQTDILRRREGDSRAGLQPQDALIALSVLSKLVVLSVLSLAKFNSVCIIHRLWLILLGSGYTARYGFLGIVQ